MMIQSMVSRSIEKMFKYLIMIVENTIVTTILIMIAVI